MGAELRIRVAVGALVFALVAPLAYDVQRLIAIGRGEAADPLLVLRQPHTAYFWRALAAAWLGAAAAGLVVLALGRAPGVAAAVARAAPWFTATVVALSTALAWAYP